jgi:hypothetical protein
MSVRVERASRATRGWQDTTSAAPAWHSFNHGRTRYWCYQYKERQFLSIETLYCLRVRAEEPPHVVDGFYFRPDWVGRSSRLADQWAHSSPPAASSPDNEFLFFSLSPSRTTPTAKPTIHPPAARRSGRPSGPEDPRTTDHARTAKPASHDNLTSASVHKAQQERHPRNFPARSKAPCSECCSIDGFRCVRLRRPLAVCDLSRLVTAVLICRQISPSPASHLASAPSSTLPHHPLPLTGPSQRPKPERPLLCIVCDTHPTCYPH